MRPLSELRIWIWLECRLWGHTWLERTPTNRFCSRCLKEQRWIRGHRVHYPGRPDVHAGWVNEWL